MDIKNSNHPKKMRAVREAVYNLWPSPAAYIMQEKIREGNFENWLNDALNNGGKLAVTEAEWKEALAKFKKSMHRRQFLSLVPLALGGMGGLSAIGAMHIHESKEKGQAATNLDIANRNLLFETKQFMQIANPNEEQKKKVTDAIAACEGAQAALDNIEVEDFKEICAYLAIGSVVVGKAASAGMIGSYVVQQIATTQQEITPALCASRLQAKLESILYKKYPEVYERLVAKRDMAPYKE